MNDDITKEKLTEDIDKYQEELNNKYKDIIYPQFILDVNCYVVNTYYGVELGDASFITDCFIMDSPYYRFNKSNSSDTYSNHSHSFKGVIDNIFYEPKSFDITGFEEDYTTQQIVFINKLRDLILEYYPQYRFTSPFNSNTVQTVKSFEEVLDAIIKNPELFSIQGYENDYSFQQRVVINNLKDSIINAKKQKRILSRTEIIKKRDYYNLLENIKKG